MSILKLIFSLIVITTFSNAEIVQIPPDFRIGAATGTESYNQIYS